MGIVGRLNREMRTLRYMGVRVRCPVCGRSARRFVPHRGRPFAKCVYCGSLERHRLLWLWLRDRIPTGARVLHAAPDPGLERRPRTREIDYLSVDLEPPHAMRGCDTPAIPEPDDAFDVVICNHVLE